MAIKERVPSVEDFPEDAAPNRKAPVVLSAEESANLYQSLASEPEPLSSEVKNAIANYQNIKAKRI